MKADWKKIGKTTLEAVKAIFKGELLLRLKIDKWIPQILVLVVAIVASVLVQLKIDEAKVRRERTREELKNATIVYDERVCELAQISTVRSIPVLIESNKVNMAAPSKPATPVR